MSRKEISPAARTMLDRVHTHLGPEPLRDVRMFGATAVMLDGAMAVAVHADGSLLVRVDPVQDEALLVSPGASRATMGADRSMGPGWIHVASTALASGTALEAWLEHASTYLRRRNGPAPSTPGTAAAGAPTQESYE